VLGYVKDEKRVKLFKEERSGQVSVDSTARRPEV
jgi:hypothetical protein